MGTMASHQEVHPQIGNAPQVAVQLQPAPSACIPISGPVLLSCITLNVGGPGKVEERCNEAKAVILQEQPDIGFTQECPRPKIWKIGRYLPEYTFRGSFEAGVLWKEDTCIYEEEEIGVLDTNTKSFIRAKYHLYFNHCERLYTVTLRHIKDGVRLLCVSWHGPNNGVTEKERVQILKELIMLITALLLENNVHGVILGGDFNLSAEWATKAIEELQEEAHFFLMTPTLTSTHRNLYASLLTQPWVISTTWANSTVKTVNSAIRPKKTIDYFLVCGGVGPQKDVLACTIIEQVKALDHNPVVVKFQVQVNQSEPPKTVEQVEPSAAQREMQTKGISNICKNCLQSYVPEAQPQICSTPQASVQPQPASSASMPISDQFWSLKIS